MRNLNNKGFTLVEVIAAVVILSVLAMLLVPSVTSLLNRSEDDAFKHLKKSILVASEEYVNDNRYSETGIGDSISVKMLLDNGYLSASGVDDAGNEYIVNPGDRNKKLNLNDSYVKVEFDSVKKDYKLDLKDDYLKWE